MTNITSLPAYIRDGDKNALYVITCADGQGTMTDKETGITTKDGATKKNYLIGGCSVLATGSVRILREVVSRLEIDVFDKETGTEKMYSAGHLAQKILDVTKELSDEAEKNVGVRRDNFTSFIVSCCSGENDWAQYIVQIMNVPEINITRGAYKASSRIVLGSGSAIVNPAWKRDWERGYDFAPKDLADAFFSAYDTAVTGETELHVNDKLQFALLGDGVRTLLAHPFIHHDSTRGDSNYRYLQRLAGFKFEEPAWSKDATVQGLTYDQIFLEQEQRVRGLRRVVGNFYNSFIGSLENLRSADVEMNKLLGLVKNDTANVSALVNAKERRDTEKSVVQEHVQVLLKPSLEGMLSVGGHVITRGEEFVRLARELQEQAKIERNKPMRVE